MEVGIVIKEVEPSIPGRLRITGEEKELLYRFLRDEIGREGIRALAILWFDEGKTEAEIADLLFIASLILYKLSSTFQLLEVFHYQPY